LKHLLVYLHDASLAPENIFTSFVGVLQNKRLNNGSYSQQNGCMPIHPKSSMRIHPVHEIMPLESLRIEIHLV
jgi:hypothetical protein